MTLDRSQSRWGKVFRLGSLPGTPEEAVKFVERRVALYFAVLFALYAVVFGLSFLFNVLAHRPITWPVRLIHLALGAFTFLLWQLISRRSWSLHTLAAFDGGGTFLICASAALFMLRMPTRTTPEYLSFVLGITQTLVVRAAIVPSDPRRTLAIGISGFLPLLAIAHFAPHVSLPGNNQPDFSDAFEVAAWGGVSAALTFVISWVIYGLRKQVEEIAHLGQYTLVEKIGAGGMGTVYRARHGMLRRPTAVKLLPLEHAGAEAIARFEREVQLTAQLTHPNIVAIYDFGRTPDGIFYYAMEYLDGVDLEALVQADGAQPPGRVVHIWKQVAAALSEAHAAGLIHRDIKPANIVLAERRGIADLAKVVDFGLVKQLEAPGPKLASSLVSGAHSFVGTPLYTAPETLLAPERVGVQSDLYALGAVAYYLLTGQPVFPAKTPIEVYASHLYENVSPPSERLGTPLPRGLDALVLACLAKDPADRPKDANDLLAALERLDEVPDWTTLDASAWWKLRGEALRRSLRPDRASGSGLTLAIDPRGRGADNGDAAREAANAARDEA